MVRVSAIKLDFPYTQEYIVYPDISSSVNFTLTENVLMDMTCFGLPSNSRSILGILNSKLVEVYLNSVCVKARGGYLRLKSQYILNIPLPDDFENTMLGKLVEDSLQFNLLVHNQTNQFIKFIKSHIDVSITRKLENWHELSFGEFIIELKKTIKATNKLRAKKNIDPIAVLTKKDEFEWMDLFEENKIKANELQMLIANTENEIDQMVYKLYGLSEEEIKIIENNNRL